MSLPWASEVAGGGRLHSSLKPFCRHHPVENAGFLGDNFKDRPLLKRINWLHLPLLAATPLMALYGVLTVPFDWRTYAFAVLYYFFSGLGITAGSLDVLVVELRPLRLHFVPGYVEFLA